MGGGDLKLSSIDERIVKMSFDNQLFEKNVHTSIGTLEKLKEALRFKDVNKDLNSLNDSVSKMDFSRIADGIDSLAKRFSFFGERARKITMGIADSFENSLKGIYNNTLGQIKTGGWSRATNIDQAKFKLEGLQVAWKDISDDINYGVDKTAYGLDAAASAAAQLVASGVEYGETFGATGNSPMAKALRGISGVAAMTNSSYEEISHIFTTAAGQGKVMTEQLRMLEGRGLNAAAQIGKVLGKSEAEIREMVTKGQIDFKTFSDAMNEAFGEQATKANNTFEGSMANMKSALSRIGAEFATPYREAMVPVFNQLRGMINYIKKQKLGQLFADASDFLGKASNLVVGVLKGIDLSWISGIVDTIHNAYMWFDNMMSTVTPLWNKVTEGAEKATKAVKGTYLTFKQVDELAQRVRNGEFGNGEARWAAIDELTGIEGAGLAVQNRVNELLNNAKRYEEAAEVVEDAADAESKALAKPHKQIMEHKTVQEEFTESTNKMGEALKRQAPYLQTAFIDILANAFTGLISLGSILGRTVIAIGSGAFEPVLKIVKTLGEMLSHVTGKFASWLASIDEFFQSSGFYTGLQTFINDKLNLVAEILDKVKGKAQLAFDVMASAAEKVVDVVGQVGTKVTEFWNLFKQTKSYKYFTDTFDKIKTRLGDLRDKVFGTLTKKALDFIRLKIKLPDFDMGGFVGKVNDALQWLINKIEEAKTAIRDFIEGKKATEGSLLGQIFTFFDNLTWEGFVDSISTHLGKALGFITDFGKGAFDVVKDLGKGFIEAFTGTEEVSDGLAENIKDSKAYQKIQEKNNTVFSRFLKIVKKIGNAAGNVFKGLVNVLAGVGKWILDFVDHFGEFWDAFKQTSAYNRISTAFDNLRTKITSLRDTIMDVVDGALSKLFGKNGDDTFKMPEFDATSFANGLSDKIDWLLDKLNAVKETIKSLFTGDKEGAVEGLKSIFGDDAVSVAVTAFAQAIEWATEALGKFFDLFGVEVQAAEMDEGLAAIDTFGNETIPEATNKFQNFAEAVNTVKETFLDIWSVLSPLLTQLVGLKVAWNVANSFKSVANFVLTVKDFVLDIEGILSAVKGFVGTASETLSKVGKSIARSYNAKAILLVALAIGALAASMWAFGQLNEDQFKMAVKGLIAVTIAIGAIVGMLSLLNFSKSGGKATVASQFDTLGAAISDFGKNLRKALTKFGIAAMMISFALAIKILVGAMKSIAEMHPNEALQGAVGLGAIMTALTAAMIAINKFSTNPTTFSNVLSFIAFAGAVYILAMAVEKLGTLDYATLNKGLISVGVLGTFIAGAMFVIGKGAAKAGPILAFTLMIAAVAASLIALSFIKPSKLQNAARVLSKVFMSLTLLAYSMSKMSGFSKTSGIVASFVGLGAIIAEVAIILALMSDLPNTDKMVTVADTLSKIFISLGVLSAAMGLMGIGSVGLMATGKIVAIIATISGIIAAIGALANELDPAGLDKLINDINKGAELAAAVGNAMGSLLGGFFGGLLGDALTNLLGDMGDTFINLPTTLSKWIEDLQPFFDNATNLDTSGCDNLKEAFGTIAAISTDGFWATIMNMFQDEDTINKVKTNLTGWAEAIGTFSTTLTQEGFKDEALEAATTASEVLGALVDLAGIKLPTDSFSATADFMKKWSGGGKEKSRGEQLAEFVDSLGPFADSMKTYGERIKDLDTSAIRKTKDAVETVMELSKLTPATGGSLQDFLGKIEPAKYGRKLGAFATGLVTYSKTIANMDGEAVTGTEGFVRMVMELSKLTPESGGVVQDIFGEIDPGAYGRKLIAFAGGLTTYSWIIGAMNKEAVKNTNSASEMIMSLSNAIPDDKGGIMAVLAGNNFDMFNENLPDLATAFVKYSENLAGFKTEDAKEVTSVMADMATFVGTIVDASNAIGQNSSFNAFYQVEQAVASFLYTMVQDPRWEEMRTSVKDLGKDIGTSIYDGLNEAFSGENTVDPNFIGPILDEGKKSNPIEGLLKNLTEAFGDPDNELKTAANEMFINLFTDISTFIDEQGVEMATVMRMGFSRMASTIMGCRSMLNSAVSSACAGMSAQAQKYASKFAQVGRNMMVGLAAGIRAGESAAINAAASAAAKALKAASDRLEVQSPSKAFMRLGDYSMQGLGLGFTKSVGVAVKAAEDSADYVTKSMNRALTSSMDSTTNELVSQLELIYQYINDVVNDGTNINPVITPVVDLSQVQNGMYSAGAMLSSAGNAFGIGALSYARSNFPGVYSYGSTAQGMSEAATLRALNGVRSDLKDLGNALSAMDMVLDNGVLVGQMGTGMDRQLGTIQKFKERWA